MTADVENSPSLTFRPHLQMKTLCEKFLLEKKNMSLNDLMDASNRVSAVQKYRASIVIQKVWRGYKERIAHSDELWQRLNKLRDKRFDFI